MNAFDLMDAAERVVADCAVREMTLVEKAKAFAAEAQKVVALRRRQTRLLVCLDPDSPEVGELRDIVSEAGRLLSDTAVKFFAEYYLGTEPTESSMDVSGTIAFEHLTLGWFWLEYENGTAEIVNAHLGLRVPVEGYA